MKRWKGKKGDLWQVFSIYIRKRDCFKYGRCVSCNKEIEWNKCDAGHFVAVTGSPLKLIFDERNVNAQCKRCNHPHYSGKEVGYIYSLELDRRWGKGTAKKLFQIKRESQGPWSDLEYKRLIAHYKQKIAEL